MASLSKWDGAPSFFEARLLGVVDEGVTGNTLAEDLAHVAEDVLRDPRAQLEVCHGHDVPWCLCPSPWPMMGRCWAEWWLWIDPPYPRPGPRKRTLAHPAEHPAAIAYARELETVQSLRVGLAPQHGAASLAQHPAASQRGDATT